MARIIGRTRTDRVELAESLCDSCFSFCTFPKRVQRKFVCTRFEDVQKSKQLSHNDSDGAGTSVRVRSRAPSIFYARCPEPVLLVALRIMGLQYSYFESILRAKLYPRNVQNGKNISKMHLKAADGALGTPSYRAKTPRLTERP